MHVFRSVLIRSCVALVAALAASGESIAQDVDALAFDEALRLAEERSQQLRAEDATALAAREMAAAAAEAPDPVLTAGINNLPVNGPDRYSLNDDFMTMRSVALSRELTRHDKRDARAERFDARSGGGGSRSNAGTFRSATRNGKCMARTLLPRACP